MRFTWSDSLVMWLIGIVLLLLVTGGLCLLIGGRPGAGSANLGDLTRRAATYTTIVGTLAGFTVTSSIFIANLSVAHQSAAFEGVMALFVIAFLIFISAAMQFGTTPDLPDRPSEVHRAVQRDVYILANASLYLGLSLSWLGLPLLLAAIGLRFLREIVMWQVLVAILGGAIRVSSSVLNRFARVDLRFSLAIPVVCFALSAFYALVLARQFPGLLPAEHGPTWFAVLCSVLGAVGFALQTTILASQEKEPTTAAIAALGDRVLLAYTAGVVTTTSLLWLAVAAAI